MTLVELLVALAIVGILLAIGVPSLTAMSEAEAVRSHVNTMLGTLRYARAEAIRHRTQVVICPSSNSESANPSCSSGSADPWQVGWIIFLNRDGDSNYSYDASQDSLLRVQGPINNSGGIVKTSGINKLVYRSTGLLLTGGASAFSFDAKSLRTTHKKMACISLQGRARVASDLSCS